MLQEEEPAVGDGDDNVVGVCFRGLCAMSIRCVVMNPENNECEPSVLTMTQMDIFQSNSDSLW